MASHELVLVFFRSQNKLDWSPVERDDIPEWMRDEALIEKLLQGNCVRNIEAENRTGMVWYTAMAIDRKEPLKGSMILPESALMRGMKPAKGSGILLPH